MFQLEKTRDLGDRLALFLIFSSVYLCPDLPCAES